MSLRLNQILGGADIRSPIFYDSNDTGYYCDPASTSRLNALSVGASGIVINGAATATDRNLKVKGASSTNVGIVLYDSSDNFRCQLYGESGSYGFLDGVWAGWDLRKSVGGSLFLNNNNTYYLNPASTTVLNALSVSVNNGLNPAVGTWHTSSEGKARFYFASNDTTYFRTGNNFVFRNNSDIGVVTIDSVGNLRTSTSGDNFASYSLHVGGTGFASADFRTPIFYDSNDTTYYTDPASFSLISSLGIGGLTSSNNVQMYDSYVDASSSYLQSPPLIVRKDSSATGAIDQAPVGLFIYNLNGTNNTWTKFSMGSREAVGAGNTVSIAGLAAQKTAGTANAWATGNLHFWTKAGATQITNMIAYSSGYVQSDYSFRSPIFYDSNDTSYYVDPASTSIMQYVRATNFYDGTGTYNVNLGSGNSEGRGLVAGYSGGSYGGIGYNVRHTTTGGSWIAPSTDTSTYLLFSNGIYFYYAAGGAAGRTLSYSTIGSLTSAGIFTVSGDVRAPVFYDSNDTSYYVDPASTSRVNTLYVANSITDSSTVNGRILLYGNLHIDAYNGYDIYCNYYSGRRFRTFKGLGTGAEIFRTDTDGIVYAYEQLRTPVLYDYNDTTYYIDPASTSNIVELKTNKNWYDSSGSVWGGGINMGGNNPTIGFQSTASTWWFMFHHSSSAINFYRRSTSGGWNQDGIWDSSSNFIWQGSSVRAPIFYDQNNTAYYTDPASTSVLYSIAAGVAGNSSANIPALKVTSSGTATTQAAIAIQQQASEGDTIIFCDFDQYVEWNLVHENANNQLIIHGGSSTGNLGSNTFYSPNGTAKTGYIKHVFDMTDGNAYIGGSVGIGTNVPSQKLDVRGTIISNSDVRAPLFYDSDNTGYYLNPAGSSQLSAVNANDWFRAQGNTGLYFQDKGYGITSAGAASNSYGNASTYGSGLNGWQGWGIGSRHCLMSNGGDNVGIHDNTRSWLYYWDGTYHRFQYGYLQSASSVRAPIFYDSDDTNYYCDPNGNSVLNGLYANAYYNLVNNYKDIYVYGDVNTYYVVLIQGEYIYSYGRYSVTRGYNWTAPDTWYLSTHKGGLTLDWEYSGDTSWGGNDQNIRIIEFHETYSTMVAGFALPVNGGVIVWLRGGGVNGALYRIRTPIGANSTVTVYDGVTATNHSSSTSFTAANSAVFSTRANTSNVASEINSRFPVRYAGILYNDGNAVVDQSGTSQTKSGILSSAASLRAPIFYDTDNTGYYLDPNSTTSLRTVGSWRSDSSSWDGEFSGKIQYHANHWYFQAADSWLFRSSGGSNVVSINQTGSVTAGQYYTGGWFRNSTSGYGLYNEVTGEHFYSDAADMWNIASANGTQGLRLRTGGYNGTVRGYFYANSSNDVGFLNQDGSWRVRVVGGDYVLFDGSSARAQLFYDSNNTSYYVDPASTSNLLGLTVANTITGNISGNAGTVTNGVYLSGAQTIGGVKTFSDPPVALNIAKAWVHFNGTSSVGVNCTVNASYNISSVAHNATGDYTVNFTNSFTDTNYVVAGTITYDYTLASSMYNGVLSVPRQSGAQSTGSCRIAAEYLHGANLYDAVAVRAVFFR